MATTNLNIRTDKEIKEAAEKSKAALANIHFEGMYYRKDIGYEFKD